MAMSEKARAAQREYMKRYREKNREKYNRYNREWRRKNPEKAKEIKNRYLENLADRYEKEVKYS